MDGTVLYLTSWLSIMLTVYGMYVKSLAPAWYSETVDDFFRCLYRYETCYLSITSCMRMRPVAFRSMVVPRARG